MQRLGPDYLLWANDRVTPKSKEIYIMGGGGGWYPTYPTPSHPRPILDPPKPKDPPLINPKPTPTDRLLIDLHTRLRTDVEDLEEVIEGGEGLSEKDLKRLDKAVVCIKIGCKLMKFVLKARGFKYVKQGKISYEVNYS